MKSNSSPLKKDIRRKLLAEEIDAVIVQAHHLQVPPPEFLELVRDRVDVFDEKRRARDGRNPE